MEKSKLYDLSLYIFRRDLRLIDNTALYLANSNSRCIIPAFFLDKRQVDKNENEYFSSNSVQFMIESLANLNFKLNKQNSKLFLFYGDLQNNIENLIKQTKIQAVYVNEDYTPFSIKRDAQIKEICQKNNIQFISCEDAVLTGLHTIKLSNGNFYKKYTPYFNAASLIKIPTIKTEENLNFIDISSNSKNDGLIFESIKKAFTVQKNNNKIKKSDCLFDFPFDVNQEDFRNEVLEFMNIIYNKNVIVLGGREEAEKKLNSIKNFKKYKETRDFPIIPSTRLSAYLKFGVVSPRELFHTVKDCFGPQHDIIRQLHWRDFYMKIVYFYPFVIGGAMKPEYNNIQWQANSKHVERWKKGDTGFPIVDAAMRCMNETGYMHNRLRMITSSFFVKDILEDWRIGEKYFANCLVDYDISLNNGGWQWSASTGTDSQPYFRIFNPTNQSEKFDKDCEFIFYWIPELKKVKNLKHIHDWETFHLLYKDKVDYPEPMLNHAKQKAKALSMFKDLYANKDEKKEIKGIEVDDDDISEEVITKKHKRENKSLELDNPIKTESLEKNLKISSNLTTKKDTKLGNKNSKGKKKALDDDQINISDSFKTGIKNKNKI